MILGTAGHIDHGKTALVRALTGVDTDRLPEEKQRGITIELGFAPLDLGDAGTLGVVDVPGHEAFVRTMLAGATGVDLALLVVAADEGAMPQTREHLAILTLLGIRGGVVALTKRDLVDEDWLALVADDVRALLAGSALADAPVVPVSARTGEGIESLRDALAAVARAQPSRDADDLFRMPVDRAFTVRGTGTVVTGTVWSGSVAREATLRVVPGGRAVRVRGVQQHGAAVERALPGSRAAIALAGVDVADVPRGAVLVADDRWLPSDRLRATVTLLADAPALRPRSRVRFHLGTADVGARIVAAGGGLAPDARRGARVVLDEPVVARAGDRFVLRLPSPAATIGGGVVDDPLPPHRRVRPWDPAPADADARLRLLLAEAGVTGVEEGLLPVRLGLPPGAVRRLASAGERVAGRLYAPGTLDGLARRVAELVGEHHRNAPLEPGAPLATVRARLAASPELADAAVAHGTREGLVEAAGGMIRRAGWVPTPSDDQRQRMDALRRALEEAGDEPPSTSELAARYGAEIGALLRLLEREGSAVAVEPERYFARTAVEGLTGRLRGGTERGREYSPSELRDLLGISRKYLIPFLEYCDRTGVTSRRSAGRVVAGT